MKKLFLLSSLFWVLCFSNSCGKDDDFSNVNVTPSESENDTPSKPEYATSYTCIVGGPSSQYPSYISIENCCVYRLERKDVFESEKEALKDVDLIFTGDGFVSPSSSANKVIRNNGIKTNVKKNWNGTYDFKTNKGFAGIIEILEGDSYLGYTYGKYVIRITYKRYKDTVVTSDSKSKYSFVQACDTFRTTIGSVGSAFGGNLSISKKTAGFDADFSKSDIDYSLVKNSNDNLVLQGVNNSMILEGHGSEGKDLRDVLYTYRTAIVPGDHTDDGIMYEGSMIYAGYGTDYDGHNYWIVDVIRKWDAWF